MTNLAKNLYVVVEKNEKRTLLTGDVVESEGGINIDIRCNKDKNMKFIFASFSMDEAKKYLMGEK